MLERLVKTERDYVVLVLRLAFDRLLWRFLQRADSRHQAFARTAA